MSDELIAHTIETLGAEQLSPSAVLELEGFALELMTVRPVEGASVLSVITELRLYRGTSPHPTERQNEEPRKGDPRPGPDRSEKIQAAELARRARENLHVVGSLNGRSS